MSLTRIRSVVEFAAAAAVKYIVLIAVTQTRFFQATLRG